MSCYLCVFVGGGLGSIARYGLGQWMSSARPQLPWATFSANLLSCFLLGILVAASMKGRLQGQWAVFLMAGFCGGFSTFSTFTNETLQLLLNGQWLKAAVYTGLSVFACLLSLYAGMKMAS
jgi:CrcB protein